MKMNKEFTHQLLESFRYSHSGEFHEAEIIKVTAPKSTGFYENLQFLDALCNRAEMRSMKNIAGLLKELDLSEEQKTQAEAQNQERTEDEKAFDAYNQTLSGLELDEIKKLNIAILELLKKSATIDGVEKFTSDMWEEISLEDKRLIIGKYLANFTVSAQRNSKN